MKSDDRYVIASRTPFFWNAWQRARVPGEWLVIREPTELTLEKLEAFEPEMIFFPHWSNIVPESIWSRFECVCFHATPVPYGRGGSPVQNMIARGHEHTTLTALRMTGEIDAGAIYAREEVSLLGGGDEIYLRLADRIVPMIAHIVTQRPEPVPQRGSSTVFKRRSPEDGALSEEATLKELFDAIRMLDAEGYPRAFVDFGPYRLEFSRAALRRNRIDADVTIRHREQGQPPDSS